MEQKPIWSYYPNSVPSIAYCQQVTIFFFIIDDLKRFFYFVSWARSGKKTDEGGTVKKETRKRSSWRRRTVVHDVCILLIMPHYLEVKLILPRQPFLDGSIFSVCFLSLLTKVTVKSIKGLKAPTPPILSSVYIIVKVGSNAPVILFSNSEDLENPKFGQELEFVLYQDDSISIKVYHNAGNTCWRNYWQTEGPNRGQLVGSCTMLLEELGKPATTTILIGKLVT